MRYEIQHYTIAYGWVNKWCYAEADGDLHPESFATADEAQAALDEFLADCEEEVAAGFLEDCDPERYRVRRVQRIATAQQPDAVVGAL